MGRYNTALDRLTFGVRTFGVRDGYSGIITMF